MMSQRVSGYHDASNPMFLPVDNPSFGDVEVDPDALTDRGPALSNLATRNDLEGAIEARDWKGCAVL